MRQRGEGGGALCAMYLLFAVVLSSFHVPGGHLLRLETLNSRPNLSRHRVLLG